MSNDVSYFNMKIFAEQRWNSKGLLEVQKVEEDLFIFRFQSEDSKQGIIELSLMPFGNMIFLWLWLLDKPIKSLKLKAVLVWVQFSKLRPHYFNIHALRGLETLIGKPVFMDKLYLSFPLCPSGTGSSSCGFGSWISKPIKSLKLKDVPLWVQFPKLRPHYFNMHVLRRLETLIGKLMFMDKLTTTQSRVAFARVCVKIKADVVPPTCINYTDEYGNDCTQEVVYEWMPMQCLNCKTFGHNYVSKAPLEKQYVGNIPQNQALPRRNTHDQPIKQGQYHSRRE